MALIEIDRNGKEDNLYQSYRIRFSLVSSPAKGRKLLRTLSSCRDFTSDQMISDANIKKSENRKVLTDFKTLRLLLQMEGRSEDKTRERMYSAKRVINMYEDLAGWASRSVMSRAKFKGEKTKRRLWLLTGPGEWMVTSHLTSMITLIFRVIVNSGGFEKLENLDQVEDRFREIIKSNTEVPDSSTYLPNSLPYFRIFMKEYDEIFRNRGNEFWFPEKMVSNWHSWGGIDALCTQRTGDDNINDLIKKISKKYKIGKVS